MSCDDLSSVKARIRCALGWGALVLALFVVVFYGVDWLTAQRTWRMPVAMQWEMALSFWPWTVAVYMTIRLAR